LRQTVKDTQWKPSTARRALVADDVSKKQKIKCCRVKLVNSWSLPTLRRAFIGFALQQLRSTIPSQLGSSDEFSRAGHNGASETLNIPLREIRRCAGMQPGCSRAREFSIAHSERASVSMPPPQLAAWSIQKRPWSKNGGVSLRASMRRQFSLQAAWPLQQAAHSCCRTVHG